MPCRERTRIRSASAASFGGDHSALAGGHVLDGVEAECRRMAVRPDLPPAVFRAHGMRRILHDGEAVPGGQAQNLVQVAGLPGVVHWNHGARARRDSAFHGLDRYLEIPVDVHDHGCGAQVGDDVGGGAKGQCRNDHLVARPDAQRRQRNLQRRRAGADGDGVADPHIAGELSFESFDFGAGRQPAGSQRVDDLLDLLLADLREAEGQEGRPARRGNCAHLEKLSKGESAGHQAEPTQLIQAARRNVAELRADLNDRHALLSEPIERGVSGGPRDAAPAQLKIRGDHADGAEQDAPTGGGRGRAGRSHSQWGCRHPAPPGQRRPQSRGNSSRPSAR